MRLQIFLPGLVLGLAGLAMATEDSSPSAPPPQSLQFPATYAEQMAAVNEGRYDIPVLLALLQDPEATSGLRPNEERAVVNEVMNSLVRMEDAAAPLEDVLMALASDVNRDPGVREYAVQHLLSWHAKTERKAKVEECLWKCTEDSVLSSGAILQLHHLARNKKSVLARPLAPVVLKALDRADLRNSDRITLLLVAAESGISDALPFARGWAESTSDQLVLQAALTAIGKLGHREDLTFLEELESRRNLDDVRKTLESARSRLGDVAIKGAGQ